MAWETSRRRQRLPHNWPALVRAVRRRANGRCEATHHHPDCDWRGKDVDHKVAGDNHHPDNLQYLSSPCHKAKTKAENAARNRLHAQLKRRPPEQHPGARA